MAIFVDRTEFLFIPERHQLLFMVMMTIFHNAGKLFFVPFNVLSLL